MQRIFYLFCAVLICFTAIVITMPMSVLAIDEVTPTAFQKDSSSITSPSVSPTQSATEIPNTDDVDIDALIDKSFEAIQNEDYETVIGNMETIIEIEPDNATAYFIRGISYMQLSQFSFAIEDLTVAIELEPWVEDYYGYRGDAYFLKNELGNALLDFETAITVNPMNAINYTRRSDIYAQLGDRGASDMDDLIARGIQAINTGDYSGAIDLLSEAIEIDANDFSLAHAYYSLGNAYLNSNDLDAAIENYMLAVEINPELHNAYLIMGIIYRLNGDLEAAATNFYNRIVIHANEIIDMELAIGDVVDLEMAYRRAYAIHFEGEAGQVISITARDTGQTVVDPLIALVAPNGDAIAGDDDFGGGLDSEISDFELPEDGTYILYLSHAEGGREFGFQGVVEVIIDE